MIIFTKKVIEEIKDALYALGTLNKDEKYNPEIEKAITKIYNLLGYGEEL